MTEDAGYSGDADGGDDGDWDDDDPPLIRCPACGADILEMSPRCPECGHYRSDEDGDSAPRRHWLVIFIAMLLLIILTLSAFRV